MAVFADDVLGIRALMFRQGRHAFLVCPARSSHVHTRMICGCRRNSLWRTGIPSHKPCTLPDSQIQAGTSLE